jgi:hypothetical protein
MQSVAELAAAASAFRRRYYSSPAAWPAGDGPGAAAVAAEPSGPPASPPPSASPSTPAPPSSAPPASASARGAGLALFARRLWALSWREWLAATRNPADVGGRMLLFVAVALFSNFLTYSVQVWPSRARLHLPPSPPTHKKRPPCEPL